MEFNEHVSDYYNRILNGKNIIIKPQKSWEFIQNKNKGREDLKAFSEDTKSISYGEMFEQWDEMAKVLSGLDIWRGNNSRVLVLMPNITKTGIVTYGSDKTGAVVDFIDPTTKYDKIRQYIETENITDVFGLDLLIAQNIGNKIEELKKDYNLNNIIVYRDFYMNSLMPNKIKLLSSGLSVVNKFSKYVVRYEDAVRNTRGTMIKYDTLNSDELDFITHTSGTTTGIGKPVPLSDHNRNSLVNEYDLAGFDWEPGMKMLHFIPYFAAYGTINTAHLGLSEGCELQQIPLFNPQSFGEYLLKYRPNVVVANTPCWLNLINNSKYSNIDLSFLKVAATGGTPTSIDDEIKINLFFQNHGSDSKLIIGYGMSELSGCALTDTDVYNKNGATGVPLPGVDLKFLDEKTGEYVDYKVPNAQGEAYIHSETMTSGILDGKKIVDTVEIDGKKYIKTKDIMRSDEYGNITYIGRIDGMFQRYDAYNVYPLHIEELFETYNGVKNCSLVKEYIPELGGNVPKIFLEVDENIISDKEEFIKKVIEESFLSNIHESNYKSNFRDMPHIWVFVDSIPQNTMGKNDLYRLNNDNSIKGEIFNIDVEEDNMSLKNYTIISQKVKIK